MGMTIPGARRTKIRGLSLMTRHGSGFFKLREPLCRDHHNLASWWVVRSAWQRRIS
ncbi:uncharacterized protein B0H18DRAFT_1061687 [Fomitopsis serialis]|uniref:uncharacterized protein n=1 Tax=Fomitopsis serialis TaxID=139415 RepID=UPI0020076565|nr:uncharacterized protein B0H18DRAFT_1061687 [Neoantrodia serialis]KAH9911552.1 hypothetical protein B0H18DRAFT_1061687 [Neoantrodia serialis]